MTNTIYSASSDRYNSGMKYRRCGKSGILLPEISLGLWHNFGDANTFANSQAMLITRLTKALPTSTLPTTTVPRAAPRKKLSA